MTGTGGTVLQRYRLTVLPKTPLQTGSQGLVLGAAGAFFPRVELLEFCSISYPAASKRGRISHRELGDGKIKKTHKIAVFVTAAVVTLAPSSPGVQPRITVFTSLLARCCLQSCPLPPILPALRAHPAASLPAHATHLPLVPLPSQ